MKKLFLATCLFLYLPVCLAQDAEDLIDIEEYVRLYQAQVTKMREKAETTESAGVPTYIEDVTVTMSVILKRDINGSLKLWVVEFGAGYEKTEVQQHTMRISFGEKGRERVASNSNPDLLWSKFVAGNLKANTPAPAGSYLAWAPGMKVKPEAAKAAFSEWVDVGVESGIWGTGVTNMQPFIESVLNESDTETLKKAQAILIDNGFNSGPIDGLIGPRTRTAIQLFQAGQGIPVTGTIDKFTYDAIFQNEKLQWDLKK
jgi:hypothetical protein